MIRVSVSALRDYEVCKRKAYHRRRKETRILTASMITGRVIHDLVDAYSSGAKTQEEYLDTYKATLMEELSKPSESNVAFLRWQSVPNLLKLVDTCFRNYLSLEEVLPPLVSSEQFFEIEYDRGVQIVGRFDQIREGNILAELKTSHREPGWYFLQADLQATLYSWAYREIYHTLPTYYYIHLPSATVYELERKNCAILFKRIDDYVNDFSIDNFTMETDGYKCSTCGYRAVCFGEEQYSKIKHHILYPTQPKVQKKPDRFFIP